MRFVTADRAAYSNVCHPERSLAESEANRQTRSKDPIPAENATDNAGNFRIVIRFHDERGTELFPGPSREVAKECSPRRQPWVASEMLIKPRRGEKSGSGTPQDGTTMPSQPNIK